jgi:hypothetical protein
MQNTINSLDVQCSRNSQHIVKMEALDRHQQRDCPDLPLVCTIEGCEELILRKDMEEHLATCGHGCVECPGGCGFEIRRNEINNYIMLCSHNMLTVKMGGPWQDAIVRFAELEAQLVRLQVESKEQIDIALAQVTTSQEAVAKEKQEIASLQASLTPT